MTADSGPTIIRTVDMHTAGEPVRIVEGGYPELKGATILEKRRDAITKNGSELSERVPEFASKAQERLLSLV